MPYFDYASAKPVDGGIVEVMLPYMTEHFGNPSSVHSMGFKARVKISDKWWWRYYFHLRCY